MSARTAGHQSASAVAGGPAAGQAGAPGHRHLGLALVVIAMAQLMVVLDATIVNVALPHIQSALGFSGSGLEWVVNAYALTFGGFLLLGGRAGDILGRKRIYGYEVLILAIGALASAFAPNYTFLLICRVILGIGIGGDYPVSATIMSEYSGKQSRGKMVGLVFAMQGSGLVVGPLVASIFLAERTPLGAAVPSPVGVTVAVSVSLWP